jgi:Domain of unknown function (DUF1707)
MTSFQVRPGGTPTGDPRIRASDADRDDAIAQLREHFAAGRLSAAEGQDRIGQALEAKTLGELDELMTDLPGLGPLPDGSSGRVAPGRASAPRPSRTEAAGATAALRKQDAARMIILITGIVVAAYAVTGLLTGIWWIPWTLIVVPAAHLIRRSRPPQLCAGRRPNLTRLDQ